MLDVTDQKSHGPSVVSFTFQLWTTLPYTRTELRLIPILLQSFLWLDEKSYTEEEDFQERKSLPAVWPSGAHWASWTSDFSGA